MCHGDILSTVVLVSKDTKTHRIMMRILIVMFNYWLRKSTLSAQVAGVIDD